VAENTWILLIGDVAGKGPEAAALSALARYTVRADAHRDPEPSRLLELLNEALVREGQRFCTAACARLEVENGAGQSLTAATAGHPPPLLVRRGGARPMTDVGILLGCYPSVSLEQHNERLEEGDAVVLYTDGVTDAQAPTRQLEEEDVAELAASYAGLGAAEVAARIGVAGVPAGGAGRDDIAVLVMKVASG
jgi:serine phosphatase RsbU (regulator of sigma subunit)